MDSYSVNANFKVISNNCKSGMELIYIQNLYSMCKYCDTNSASYSISDNLNSNLIDR